MENRSMDKQLIFKLTAQAYDEAEGTVFVDTPGPYGVAYIDIRGREAEEFVQRFAALVAEECAKLADEEAKRWDAFEGSSAQGAECAADAIRAKFNASPPSPASAA